MVWDVLRHATKKLDGALIQLIGHEDREWQIYAPKNKTGTTESVGWVGFLPNGRIGWLEYDDAPCPWLPREPLRQALIELGKQLYAKESNGA